MGPVDMNCLNPSHQRPQMGHSVVETEPLVLYRLTGSTVWTESVFCTQGIFTDDVRDVSTGRLLLPELSQIMELSAFLT